MPVKTCVKCGTLKPIEKFNKCKSHSDGLASWCKQCNSEHCKMYLDHRRNLKMQKAYGITGLDKLDMIDKQKGCCAICSKKFKGYSGYNIHVDHDHDNGKVRGILCNTCNLAVGQLEKIILPNHMAFMNYLHKWEIKHNATT